jgi:hypothetical protein
MTSSTPRPVTVAWAGLAVPRGRVARGRVSRGRIGRGRRRSRQRRAQGLDLAAQACELFALQLLRVVEGVKISVARGIAGEPDGRLVNQRAAEQRRDGQGRQPARRQRRRQPGQLGRHQTDDRAGQSGVKREAEEMKERAHVSGDSPSGAPATLPPEVLKRG